MTKNIQKVINQLQKIQEINPPKSEKYIYVLDCEKRDIKENQKPEKYIRNGSQKHWYYNSIKYENHLYVGSTNSIVRRICQHFNNDVPSAVFMEYYKPTEIFDIYSIDNIQIPTHRQEI